MATKTKYSALYEGYVTTRTTARPYTHVAVIGREEGKSEWFTWHTSEDLARRSSLTRGQRQSGYRVIAVVPALPVVPMVNDVPGLYRFAYIPTVKPVDVVHLEGLGHTTCTTIRRPRYAARNRRVGARYESLLKAMELLEAFKQGSAGMALKPCPACYSSARKTLARA